MTDGGLRHAESSGGAGEASFFGDGREGGEVVEIVFHIYEFYS